MSETIAHSYAIDAVTTNGRTGRIWSKGEGRPIYWLASSPMLLRWTAAHDAFAKGARLVVCSLPGFPGGTGHDTIFDHLSWCLAARDLLAAAGFQQGDTLMGNSSPGALAADVAAIWPDWVGKLVLTTPFGIYDDAEPTRDMYALPPKQVPQILSEYPDRYRAQIAAPEGIEPVLWQITVIRGNEASARILWPLGNTRVIERLHRITAPTLVLWGEVDQIQPHGYAERFAHAIGANASVVKLPGAGHLVELDQPEAAAAAVLRFVG